MEKNTETQKHTLESLRLHSAEGEVTFYAGRLESELKWLESSIADIRREVSRDSVHEARNLVAKAGDVSDYVGKLRGAHERVALLKDLVKDDDL